MSAANEPSTQEIKAFGDEELLQWIQQKKPKLLRGENLTKFQAAFIDGDAFLNHAGDVDFFEKRCGLPPGISVSLANLASEVIGKKSKSCPPYYARHATASS